MTDHPQQQQQQPGFVTQHSTEDDDGHLPAPMEDDDETNNIIMSVVEDGPNFCVAAYDEDENQILLEQLTSNGYETADMVERILSHIRPTLLLLPNKVVCHHALFQLLTTPPPAASESANDNNSQQPSSFPYRIIKTSSLDVRNCKALILRLRVKSLLRRQQQQQPPLSQLDRMMMSNQPRRHFPNDQHSFQVSNYHCLASVIDFDSKVQIQALGSLLSFLETSVFHDREMAVHDIVQAHSSMFVKISSDTLSALQIFSTEHHPLRGAKGSGNSKEGFSLFSFLDNTRTRAGRERLREWMLKPLMNVDDISFRQDGVELVMLADLQGAVKSLLQLIRHVGPVQKILIRMEKAATLPHDFLILPRALANAIAILELLEREFLWKLRGWAGQTDVSQERQQEVDPELVDYIDFVESLLQRTHLQTLQNLYHRILSIVDEEATAQQDALVVRSGFDATIDEYKDKYANLSVTCDQIATDICSVELPHLPRNIVSVMFFPQVGFLIALRKHSSWCSSTSDAAAVNLPQDYSHVFTEGSVTYFKNPRMFELDNTIGDLDAFIKDAEHAIATQLEEDILAQETELRETFSTLADLDCILSLADTATRFSYVRPEVVPAEEQCILIRNGGHPLQEQIVDDFIRNDTTISQEQQRVNILTGPNFSGKSCYARQVGVLTYMAHLGCFLPCESARISVVDRIMAQFSSVETCSVPQSSFQLDLTRTGAMLRSGTKHSLVLVDEFGKGTSPASGIALLASALKSLSKRGCKVMCTTHFLEIFSMDLIRNGQDGVHALQMKVHVPDTRGEMAKPLFQLQDGVATSSAGLVCAKMAGVRPAILDRASEIVTATKQGRHVDPLTELLRVELDLSTEAKETLGQCVSTDWKQATDEEIVRFRNKVSEVLPRMMDNE